MRYFLGFDLSAKTKLSIEAWRNNALPKFTAPIPAKNFHITSVFLGQITEQQLGNLCQSIDEITLSKFELTFDLLGYWAKPKILWLGCSEVSSTSLKANQSLTSQSIRAGIAVQKRDYVPHITLVRKNTTNPPAPLIEPNFHCTFDQIHLFESVSCKQSGGSAVQYPIRRSWELY